MVVTGSRRRRGARPLVVVVGVIALATAAAAITLAVLPNGGHGTGRRGAGTPSGRSVVHRTSDRGSSGTGSSRPQAAGAAALTVRTAVLPLVDTSRIAVVDGVAGPRHLPTEVWYPVGGVRRARPLVVFAAGYLQCPVQYEPLLAAWASAGFVVAAPTFPLTNCAVPGGAEEADILNQPADVAFVIHQLEEASEGSDAVPDGQVLRGRIDPAEVAVAGQSDGGDTVAALAANTCCDSVPVQAVMVLSGAELASFGGRYFPPGSPPLLVVQGTADTVNVPSDSLTLYDDDTAGPKVLVLLDGADHLTPYEGANPTEQVVAEVTVAFLDQELRHLPGAASALAAAGNQPGIDTLQADPGP